MLRIANPARHSIILILAFLLFFVSGATAMADKTDLKSRPHTNFSKIFLFESSIENDSIDYSSFDEDHCLNISKTPLTHSVEYLTDTQLLEEKVINMSRTCIDFFVKSSEENNIAQPHVARSLAQVAYWSARTAEVERSLKYGLLALRGNDTLAQVLFLLFSYGEIDLNLIGLDPKKIARDLKSKSIQSPLVDILTLENSRPYSKQQLKSIEKFALGGELIAADIVISRNIDFEISCQDLKNEIRNVSPRSESFWGNYAQTKASCIE